MANSADQVWSTPVKLRISLTRLFIINIILLYMVYIYIYMYNIRSKKYLFHTLKKYYICIKNKHGVNEYIYNLYIPIFSLSLSLFYLYSSIYICIYTPVYK